MQLAANSVPDFPMSCVLRPPALLLLSHSAAVALILLTRLLLGALLVLYCNCCQTYNYRVSQFAPRDDRSLTTLTRPASREVDAAKSLSLPPLLPSVFGPVVVVTSCGHKCFNSILSGLSKSSSRSSRFCCVGVCPYTNPRTQCHKGLLSQTLSRSRYECTVFVFRRAQRTWSLPSRPVFRLCAVDHHHVSARRLPFGALCPTRIHVHFHGHAVAFPSPLRPAPSPVPSSTCMSSSTFFSILVLGSPSSCISPSRHVARPTCPG